jgi:hypothetical protein
MASRYSLSDPTGISRLLSEVERQSIIVGYINVFWGLAIVSVLFMFTVFFLNSPGRARPAGLVVHAE